MIIMLEGPPRAGKSYTAVKEHILPAINKGRKVYARLNGLDHAKIAEYLKLPVERVQELLVIVSQAEVVELFTVKGDDPPVFNIDRSALVVIDEVHEFYQKGRQALPKEQGNFFAKHGHIGLDVILMTQAIQDLHSNVVRRIERKSIYVKQNALGRPTHYTARLYSVADQMGKFEKIGSESKAYDPEIWPLYHGFQPGTENTEAYSEGTKTVWQVIKWPAIAMSVLLAIGLFFLVRFFTSGKEEVAKAVDKVPTAQRQWVDAPMTRVGGSQMTGRAQPPPPKAPEKTFKNPGVRHVVDLVKLARPRYLGEFKSGRGVSAYYVEFRAQQGQAMDRLTSVQLEALGWTVTREVYGLKAEAEGESIIFTEWPIDVIGTQSSVTTARISAAAGSPPQAQRGSPSTAASITETASTTQGVVISKEGHSGGKTMPESPGYGCESCGG